MRHYFDAVLHPSTGAALEGVLVRIFDENDALVDIYADENSTPIETVSGEANAAATDSDGMFSLYVPDGVYTVRFYQGDTVLKTIANVDLGVEVTHGELADTTGAALVGTSDGSTVQAGLDARPELDAVAFTDASLPNPVVLRTIMLDAQVSRMLAGAGDGSTEAADVTAETAKFQAIIDQGRSFSVPEPSVSYNVNTLTLVNGQTIEGCGQFRDDNSYQFVGNGVDPVFQIGAGSLAGPRRGKLSHLSVFNDGAACIKGSFAPNTGLDAVRARSENLASGATVDLEQCFRFLFDGACDITASGGGWAVRALNQCNGMTMLNPTCSGGTGGGAILIEQSSAVSIDTPIIESSKYGIYWASTSGTGTGACAGGSLLSAYLEQCEEPLVLGKVNALQGFTMRGGNISNDGTSAGLGRTAAIQLGRIRASSIQDLLITPQATEDGVWLWMDVNGGDMEECDFSRIRFGATPLNRFVAKGTYATDWTTKINMGSKNRFGFMMPTNGVPLGTQEVREWTSPLIDFSDKAAPDDNDFKIWLASNDIAFAGKVLSAEIIDFDGISVATGLNGVRLFVGRTGATTETVSITDLGTLTFADGRSKLTLGVSNIRAGENMVWKVDRSPAATPTGKARLRLRYRFN